MYNTSYEEYMRTVLGYTPNCIQDTYQNENYFNNNVYPVNNNLESMYPEIYRVLEPLIRKECMNVNCNQIDNETLEKMTNNVLNSVSVDLKIETNNRAENRKDDRQISQNRFLNDLIKILLLKELLNKPRPYYPQRPPMPRPRPIF